MYICHINTDDLLTYITHSRVQYGKTLAYITQYIANNKKYKKK